MQNNKENAENPNLFPIVLHEGVQVVDSRLIAEELDIDHGNFMETLKKYQKDTEINFGKLPFETEAIGKTKQRQKYALLNESQATFLVTLSRNTPSVVTFKAKLVLSFQETRKDLARVWETWYEMIEFLARASDRDAECDYDEEIGQLADALKGLLCTNDLFFERVQRLEKTNRELKRKQTHLESEVKELKSGFEIMERALSHLAKKQATAEQLLIQMYEQVESLMKRFGIDADCFVYVLFSPMLGWHKIGWSESVGIRKKQLETALKDLEFVMAIPTASRDAAIALENMLHTHFVYCQERGEWFTLTMEALRYLENLRYSQQQELELRGV